MRTRLAEAERKAADLAQQKAKAEAKLARTRLVAPIDGVVQQLSATTIGQVVTTGQQMMSIAPLDSELNVEVFVSNVDIAFVHVGQAAEVKVDAFPFTRFGTVPAKVTQIAADAIDEQEAKRRQANVIGAQQAAPTSQPGQPQPFVFPVRLALDRNIIDVYGRKAPLTPGMTVTAEIKTDRRRVIDYLLSPIAKIGSEAMRER
ncbi:MAG: HlyD family efflux transporter periplasmic adaptor subunit [Rhizobiales bacterium]|nr:HlyD family efflux transporter periplasmic adaptor subunit [Hyphomicrobiales bacterium]